MESMQEQLNELSEYAYSKIRWYQFSIEDILERLQNISNAVQKMDERWTRNDEATRNSTKMLKWINLSTIHTCLDCLKEPKLTSNTKPDIIACLGACDSLDVPALSLQRSDAGTRVRRVKLQVNFTGTAETSSDGGSSRVAGHGQRLASFVPRGIETLISSGLEMERCEMSGHEDTAIPYGFTIGRFWYLPWFLFPESMARL
ncbi:hypothetical protein F2Q69_00013620 [Brassica cretica]|uniref:Uncharacterized protein n=1 Tax=Brassica cretica TaxID=69181 RepID=A0A8S9QHV1_BRACR|nr:hypothetical protein F2Q69_00013620 [Brassica cretica]